jgi:hypothetical protein
VTAGRFADAVCPGAVIMFGEMHGTAEVPRFVRALLANQFSIVLGIEWPASLQSVVTAFIDGKIDRTELLAEPNMFWDWRDGRGSEEMVALLASAAVLRAAGYTIRVVCFDGVFPSAEERDAGMGATFAAAVDPSALNLAICGNLHARTSDPRWMGWHVRERYPELLALNVADDGGTAWCILDGGEPGVHEMKGARRAEPRELGVILFEQRDEHGYDGELYVGTTTASSPAK